MEKSNDVHSIYFGRLFLAFIIATVFFIMAFILAQGVAYNSYKGVVTQNNILDEFLEEMKTISMNQTCSDESLFEASEILDRIGPRIGLLEQRFGKNDLRVLEQKKIYSDLEIRHFEIVKYLNENCGGRFITILFFYSNNKKLIDESEKVGFILGKFKDNNLNRVMTYSFDGDLDYDRIINLKTEYSLDVFPILVLNEEHKLHISNIDDLNIYL